jgi:hypothetical protein
LRREKVGAPYWSNNSEYLAFLSARWENESNFWEPDFIWDGIYEVGLAGGEPQKILELEGEWFSVGGWSPDNERISIFRYDADGSSSLLVLNRHSSRLELTVREAMDEPLQWYKSGLLVGKVLEGTNGLYTEVFYIDQGGRERSLTNNGGWKNSFLLWADRLAYVRGDTIHSSYPLYVEILALP